MSAAFGSFLTTLGEGAGDYGQLQYKGTIDALNDEAEMAKSQRLMSLEETQLASSNMFKMATLDMGQQRLQLTKEEGVRAKEKHEKTMAASVGKWFLKEIKHREPTTDALGTTTSIQLESTYVLVNDVTGEVKPYDGRFGDVTGGGAGGKTAYSGGSFDTYYKEYQKAWKTNNPDRSAPDWDSDAIRNGVKEWAEKRFTFTGGTPTPTPTLTPKPDPKVINIPTGDQDLQPYEWSKDRLDYELKHFSQKKGTRKAVKKIISEVGESIDEVIEKLSVDNKEDNAFIARLLGTGADGIIYMVNQFAPGEEVYIETELGAVQWLMDNRGMTIADVVKWFRTNSKNQREVIKPGDADAAIPTENIDPRNNQILSDEAKAALANAGVIPPENVVGYGPGGLGDISPRQGGLIKSASGVDPWMTSTEPDAFRALPGEDPSENLGLTPQGSEVLAKIAQYIAEPIESIAAALELLPSKDEIIAIVEAWPTPDQVNPEDVPTIQPVIDAIKAQIKKIKTGAIETVESWPIPDYTQIENATTGTTSSGVVPQGLIEPPIPEGLGLPEGKSWIQGGVGNITEQMASPFVEDAPREIGKGVQIQPLPPAPPVATLPLEHGQDDDAGQPRPSSDYMMEGLIRKAMLDAETNILKMNYDQVKTMIDGIVKKLKDTGMDRLKISQQILNMIGVIDKADAKSNYARALTDVYVELAHDRSFINK